MSRAFKLFVLSFLALLPALWLAPSASADDWTPWYSIQDGHLNCIDVRYRRSPFKSSDGRTDINYQFRNRYTDVVELNYKIIINAGEVAADSPVQLDAKGGTSFEGYCVHSAKDIWVKVERLRRAGTANLMPRGE